MKKLLTFNNQQSTKKGFTLIELLIVIVIIATLAVTVFVALNPAKRVSDARDARRTSDVQTILTAIHQSIVDNKGTLPTNLTALPVGSQRGIGTGLACDLATTDCAITETACVDMMSGTQNMTTYLASMPIDPIGGTTYTVSETGYHVKRDLNGIITLTACGGEGTGVIQASR